MQVSLIPRSGRPLEKEMETHSNILAWETPWIEKSGRLQSMELQSRTQLKRLSRYAHNLRLDALICLQEVIQRMWVTLPVMTRKTCMSKARWDLRLMLPSTFHFCFVQAEANVHRSPSGSAMDWALPNPLLSCHRTWLLLQPHFWLPWGPSAFWCRQGVSVDLLVLPL